MCNYSCPMIHYPLKKESKPVITYWNFLMASIFFISLITSFCTSISAQTYYEHSGIVSIELESLVDENENWYSEHYYTGMVARPYSDEPLSFNLNIERPGSYNVWLLAARSGEDPNIRFQLIQHGNLIDSDELTLPKTNALRWQSGDSNGQEVTIDISEPGSYIFKISTEFPGLLLDKLYLSLDNTNPPSGYGYPETNDPNLDPITAKDNQEIALPPAWAFGMLYGGYADQEGTLNRMNKLLDFGFPVDAMWIDSWFWDYQNEGDGPGGYIDFEGDRKAYPDLDAMFRQMEKKNIKSGIWIWDAIQRTGNKSVYDDFESRGFFDTTYTNTNGWHNEGEQSLIGNINFGDPEAAKYWQQLMKPFFEFGVDFLKLDRSSAIPFTRTAFDATQRFNSTTNARGFVLAHVHSTYKPEHKMYPTKWTGDAKIDWSQPDYPDFNQYAMGGFKENIAMVADPHLTTYETPFLTHDVGGYNFFGADPISDELYVRWFQFGAFNTITTVFTAADNPTHNLPWAFSDSTQNIVLEFAQLRAKLFPYLYSHAIETYLSGVKPIRGDGKHPYQYLFGKDVLVAPVYQPDARSQTLYLDGKSNWFNYWTHDQYKGGQSVEIDAPLEQLPLMVRAGSVIPYRKFSQQILSGSNDTLLFEIYPGAGRSITYYEDDEITTAYKNGKIANYSIQWEDTSQTITISAMEGEYRGLVRHRVYEFRVIGREVNQAKHISQDRFLESYKTKVRGKSATIFTLPIDVRKKTVIQFLSD